MSDDGTTGAPSVTDTVTRTIENVWDDVKAFGSKLSPDDQAALESLAEEGLSMAKAPAEQEATQVAEEAGSFVKIPIFGSGPVSALAASAARKAVDEAYAAAEAEITAWKQSTAAEASAQAALT